MLHLEQLKKAALEKINMKTSLEDVFLSVDFYD
ncbi:hypothetical protein EC846_3354 [Acinetobacter sp. BIGb0102]|nr:hypothetical protein EC846_3354 [Acinetobacter sp. BIGb0102]